MDTVGRLGNKPLSILATESATEWAPVFRGVGFTTGIPIETVPGASESSDQQSFINQGIAGIQVFTGAHLDYHRPSDTPDKVDTAGMVKVATVVKETATYLSERPEPLTVTGAGRGTGTAEQTQASASGERRRVSFGTVPDFAHQGKGVGVESVIPDSGAARAGIRAGDVITSINGEEIADLGEFSGMLKRFSPGDVITGDRHAERRSLRSRAGIAGTLMLITFHSEAYADITMFGEVGKKMLALMGHSGTVPGAIKAADVPGALEKLTAAVSEQGDEPLGQSQDEDDPEAAKQPVVSLRQRAFPLLELLRAAAASESDVTWR